MKLRTYSVELCLRLPEDEYGYHSPEDIMEWNWTFLMGLNPAVGEACYPMKVTEVKEDADEWFDKTYGSSLGG